MVTAKKYIPEKGDVVWMNLNPTLGHEQQGRRPVCVVSPRAYNEKSGLAVICPITNQEKGYPFEVRLTGGVTGVVLSDQVRSVDWKTRKVILIEVLPTGAISQIETKLLSLIRG